MFLFLFFHNTDGCPSTLQRTREAKRKFVRQPEKET